MMSAIEHDSDRWEALRFYAGRRDWKSWAEIAMPGDQLGPRSLTGHALDGDELAVLAMGLAIRSPELGLTCWPADAIGAVAVVWSVVAIAPGAP